MSDHFFAPPKPVSVNEIASLTQASVSEHSGGDVLIDKAGPIEAASIGAISFLENAKYISHLENTGASAVICAEKYVDHVPKNVCALIHPNPYLAYAQTLKLLYPTAMRPQPITGETAISSTADLSSNVVCEDDVIIEPGCIVGENVQIGRGSHILAGAIIGKNVKIGRACTIGARVTLTHALVGDGVIIHAGATIGQDGFGFAMGPQGHAKIPQIGRVIIQDNVEIGANSTIDRGANRDTIIGEGCKIDNLVQIGHNVVMGRHCVIVGLVGISGSAQLGDFVVVAGQAGIIGHVNIGSGAQVGGGTGVHRDVEPGEKIMGYPSIPADLWMRQAAKTVRDAKKWRNKGK